MSALRVLIAVLASLALICLGTSASRPTHAAPRTSAAAAISCTKIFVIGARGSGDQGQQNDGMGAASYSFASKLESGLLGYGWQSSDISLVGLNYPAVSVLEKNWRKLVNGIGAATGVGFLGAYHDSVVEGKQNLRKLIVRLSSDCPTARLVLTGHSQGAQVVGDVLQGKSSQPLPDKALKMITGVVLFGDPYFNEDDPFAGQFVQNLPVSGGLGKRKPYATRWRGAVFSYCHSGDPVCQSGGLKFSSHTNYGSSPEPKQAAAYFSTIIGRGMSANILGFSVGGHGLAAEGTESAPAPECNSFGGTLTCNPLGNYPKKCTEIQTVPAVTFSASSRAKQWYVCMDEGFHGWLPLNSDRTWKVDGTTCKRSWIGKGMARHEELKCQAGKHGFVLEGGGGMTLF